jgi:hypothetical protein
VRTRVFGTHTLSVGAVNITPTSIIHTRAFGTATVSNDAGGPPGDQMDSYGPGAPYRGRGRHHRPKMDVSA